jgi:RNA-directed DNA polymerase
VNFADDFVILSRRKAAEAMNWTRQVVTRMGVTLNEAKTSIKQARKESFNFLGYTFGPHRYKKDGHWYLGASVSLANCQIGQSAAVFQVLIPLPGCAISLSCSFI